MKIYCDTMVLAHMRKKKKELDAMISAGHCLLFTNTAIDCRILQDNYTWTKNMLRAGTIRVEMWNTLDETTRKPFYWSSVDVLTPSVDKFLDVLQYLPRKRRFARLASLINKYGIPRGSWEQGVWIPPVQISRADAKKLGLKPIPPTRTEIFIVGWEKGLTTVLERYNVQYKVGIALQHKCDAMLTTTGEIVPMTQFVTQEYRIQ